jgi:hypothetical protein
MDAHGWFDFDPQMRRGDLVTVVDYDGVEFRFIVDSDPTTDSDGATTVSMFGDPENPQ